MNFFQKWKLKSLLKRALDLNQKRFQGSPVELADVVAANMTLARFYEKHPLEYNKLRALEYYRIAANLGDPEAQYQFAMRKLEIGKFWQEWAKGEYGSDVHQAYARACFDEAFNYLRHAEESNHALAKRLHGMAFIHGWGLDANKEQGFKLVVDSIEIEKAWDKATDIFTKLGLNTPEFFSSIMALKQKSVG